MSCSKKFLCLVWGALTRFIYGVGGFNPIVLPISPLIQIVIMERVERLNQHLSDNPVAGVRVGGDLDEIKRRIRSWNEYLHKIVPSRLQRMDIDRPSKEWDNNQFDILVVGFGAAGASAALEAADSGMKVLLVDRFDGGGSTRRSGGVYYAGGGTTAQKDLGIQDTPENMFDYIKQENGGVVDDRTIRDFCFQSPENFRWLENRVGIPFKNQQGERILFETKTSYPPSNVTLYQSGNESAHPYSKNTIPVPRGNRAFGEYLTGNIFFGGFEKSVEDHPNITVKHHCMANKLIMQDENTCTGVSLISLPDWEDLRSIHVMLHEIGSGSPMFDTERTMDLLCKSHEQVMFNKFGITHEIKAPVVLACGGFYFNKEMVEKYAPKYNGLMPLGNLGDDGTGHTMAAEANIALDCMDRCSAWKFINPPLSMVEGVLTNSEGERVGNEDVYGASFADFLVQHHSGKGWLVIDKTIWHEANSDCTNPESGLQQDQQMQGLANLHRNCKQGNSVQELALATGMDVSCLEKTIDKYNHNISLKNDVEFGKDSKFFHRKIEHGPFFAINLNMAGNKYWPTPCMSLGGVKVDGKTGQALSSVNEKVVNGLYAAGRCATGIASNYYVSGFSLADCVFSGRRAGKHASNLKLDH